MKNYKNLKLFLVITIMFSILVIAFVKFNHNSFANPLENDIEVQPLSELTYYLVVSYDGVDKYGVTSSDATVSDVSSGAMFIEDKIPDGLEFIGFVTTSDGSIGAVKRSNSSSCPGKVLDDTHEASNDAGEWNAAHTEYTYHGLHYNAETRTVSFQVKHMKAGCELTVGIITKTPTVDDPSTPQRETRRDFYNFASARERTLTVNSNTVHTFMGSETVSLYNVTYEYDGPVPDGAPSLPSAFAYAPGSSVGVASNVSVEGYTFSGWTTSDAVISNHSFVMPEGDVTLRGSFSEIPSNKVTYTIIGNSPVDYVIPREKSYYPGTVVPLDTLKAGDVVGDYRFLGWESTDVTIGTDLDFTMPDHDVLLVGKFESVTYQVIYQFYDTIVPPNSSDYLPEAKKYSPGATITLEDVGEEPTGYVFMGWYQDSEFTMPNSDVVIYGEWRRQVGTFAPTITKEVLNQIADYKLGDAVELKITITNTADFPIQNVMIKELQENAFFIEGTGYTISSNHIANILELDAHESIELYAKHIVGYEDVGEVQSQSEIVGASASNGYSLENGSYVATATFHVLPKLKICNEIVDDDPDEEFQFHITGESGNFDELITLENGQCEVFQLNIATYHVKELIPDGYTIKEIRGSVSKNDSNFSVVDGRNYEITFVNKHLSIIDIPDTFKHASSMIILGAVLMILAGIGVVFFTLRKKDKSSIH